MFNFHGYCCVAYISVVIKHYSQCNWGRKGWLWLTDTKERKMIMEEQMQRTQADIMWRQSKWEVAIKSLPSGFRKSHGREGGKTVRARVDGGHWETRPSQSTEQGTYELTDTEHPAQGPRGLHRVLCIYYSCSLSISMGLLTVRKTGPLTRVPPPRTPFLHFSCHVQHY